MLIPSPRPSRADLAAWARAEEVDVLLGSRPALAEKARKSLVSLAEFFAAGPCYVGTSWGKDSVVVAHLLWRSRLVVPLVWVRVDPVENPDCVLVRDAMLKDCPELRPLYREIVVECPRDADGLCETGPKRDARGFDLAAQAAGAARYVSGVRGAESGPRRKRMRYHGVSTDRTCAPIGWWSTQDVFAYLAHHRLPVHPAYACGISEGWDRERLRVSSLGHSRATWRGRIEWERRYYRAEMRALYGDKRIDGV